MASISQYYWGGGHKGIKTEGLGDGRPPAGSGAEPRY